MLHQFEQHSINRRWMHKSYQATTGANARRFINQPCTFAFQLGERSPYIVNLNRNVMHSRSTFAEKLSHRCLGSERLEQFEVSVADGHHANLYALILHFFRGMHFKPESVFPDRQTVFDALSGYSDVIKFEQPE